MASKAHDIERPSVAESRAELERIIGSDSFAASPRLASFLRYVVETTLAGRGECLKGYTVGVEALGRREDFDPQTDPIVRVEAGRLRAALARYYAGAGRDDPIVIELPRGTYVPTFRRRSLPLGLRKYSFSGRRLVFRNALRRWRSLAMAAAFAALASIVCNIALVTWWWTTTSIQSGPPRSNAGIAQVLPASSAFPLVFVEQFNASGLAANAAIAVGKLRNKLRDGLARFEEIEVASDPDWLRPNITTPARPAPRGVYRIAATAEDSADGAITISFRLHDANDGTIVWTRVVENIQLVDASLADEKDLVHRLAATLAQAYGVIYARELAKGPAGNSDPRYRCLLAAFEYYRWHDPDQRAGVRKCVHHVTAIDPAFANGYAVLAFQHLRDYYDTGASIALDRAMKAAHWAVSLDPESARAHQVLMNVLYARGEIAAALAQGEKAISLNPYDMIVLTSYGIRLLWSGETDKAMALLQQAADYGPGQPQFLYFALFMGAYSRGDDVAAAQYAHLLASDTYVYGLAARAIVAARAGQGDQARLLLHKLVQLRPGWRENARREIERYGTPTEIAARMAGDLSAAGLGASN